MDEEKVTQTAMEPAQQPKPKARGGQRTQGKTAPGTGQGRMAKPHASNSNTAHRKTGTQKQKSEPQNTKSPQEPKTRAEQAEHQILFHSGFRIKPDNSRQSGKYP